MGLLSRHHLLHLYEPYGEWDPYLLMSSKEWNSKHTDHYTATNDRVLIEFIDQGDFGELHGAPYPAPGHMNSTVLAGTTLFDMPCTLVYIKVYDIMANKSLVCCLTDWEVNFNHLSIDFRIYPQETES